MPRTRSALVVIALYWLAFTFVVSVVIGVVAYAQSPDRSAYGEWVESLVGPTLYLWGFYGVIPSVLLLIVAFFVRAFRLRNRRAA